MLVAMVMAMALALALFVMVRVLAMAALVMAAIDGVGNGDGGACVSGFVIPAVAAVQCLCRLCKPVPAVQGL